MHAVYHAHAPNPAPLIVRLRDIAPGLIGDSHGVRYWRARLALDRIVDHADALDRARDQAAAWAALAAVRSADQPVADFTGTVVTPQAAVFAHRPTAVR